MRQRELGILFYDELYEYKRTHGHCNVPKEHETLRLWVQDQGENRRKCQNKVFVDSKLYLKRVYMLDTIGFDWGPGVS